MKKVFDEYVKNYDMSEDRIILKYKHSLEVQKISLSIAKKSGYSKRDVFLAEVIGLFHDIARFKQVRDYDTFDDTLSFDHGYEGSLIFMNEIADKFDLSDDERSIISNAILYHNAYEIGKVKKGERRFCKLIRDADKLDILRIINDKDFYKGKELGVLSKEALDDFMHHHLVYKEHTKSVADHILIKFSFIWDFNYRSSLLYFYKNFYESLKLIYNNEIFEEVFKEIDNYLREVI